MKDLRLSIVGIDGMVGSALAAACRDQGVDYIGTTRREGAGNTVVLDLAKDLIVPAAFEGSCVVLCAAMSGFKACLDDPATARRVNVDAARKISSWCAKAGSRLVFFSTSSVFSGDKDLPFEDEPVDPKTIYGRLKAEAERIILESGCSYGIIRPTKVFHKNLVLLRSWCDALKAGQMIRPCRNLSVAPCLLEDVLSSAIALARDQTSRIVHISSTDECTYADIALHLAAHWNRNPALVAPASLEELGVELEHVPLHARLGQSQGNRPSSRCGWRDVVGCLEASIN
jgi:dTDP-4-dehydrorhamnose reductase